MSGLYLHIPFCRRKCPYCDFYSIPAAESQLNSYPDLLIQHLTWASEHEWSGPFDTVYFGGGTPSLLSPAAIVGILNAINQKFGLTEDAEITLEANPGTVSQQSLTNFRSAGINRLSLGLQSCNDKHLNILGRLHTRQQGIEVVSQARRAGFDNISLDLMFALPGQTLSELKNDILLYLELEPEHLSCYGLTVEPRTEFQQRLTLGEITLPDDEFYAQAFMLLHDELGAAGYEHYEIANYAREGFQCRHNLGYWQRKSYLGIGAGAHSFQDGQWGSRWEVPSELAAYQQSLREGKEPMLCLERFDRESALRESVYLTLRTRRGIFDQELRRTFGTTMQETFPEAIASNTHWLTNNNGQWSLTPSGWLLFDRLILPFL